MDSTALSINKPMQAFFKWFEIRGGAIFGRLFFQYQTYTIFLEDKIIFSGGGVGWPGSEVKDPPNLWGRGAIVWYKIHGGSVQRIM